MKSNEVKSEAISSALDKFWAVHMESQKLNSQIIIIPMTELHQDALDYLAEKGFSYVPEPDYTILDMWAKSFVTGQLTSHLTDWEIVADDTKRRFLFIPAPQTEVATYWMGSARTSLLGTSYRGDKKGDLDD